ncbi:MAG: hypothetical protein ACOX5G_02265 [Kiritimatiellia bacterium]|jgi:hypothetical protein
MTTSTPTLRSAFALLALAALAAAPSRAQEPGAEKPYAARNRAAVERWTAEHPAVVRGGDAVWSRNGIVADRDAGAVELLAETCGLYADNTVEFLLIGPGSEKGYEAFAQTFAAAGDVARAIEFVGVPRGRIADPASYAYWSKGERVIVESAAYPEGDWSPIEEWVLDRRAGATLPAVGFVYTGSQWSGEGDDATCIADDEQPRSILATYNERFSVLDVPRRAPQGAVYETYVHSPGKVPAEGTLLRVRIRPATRDDGLPRVRSLALRVSPADGEGLAALRFSVSEGGTALLDSVDATALFTAFARMAQDGFDPFVTVGFDPAVTLGSATLLAQALDRIDGENGIRVEAPPAGQPYFRAFLPNEAWRARENRATQPWELHMAKDGDGAWKATATFIHEDWSDPNSLDPKLTPQDIPLDDWPMLLAKTKELKGLAALFVFAPPDMPLSAVLPAIETLTDPRFSFHFFIVK